jgi:hypothetical protein
MAATPREMSEMSKMGNLLSETPKMGTFPTRQNEPFSAIGPVERLKGWHSEDAGLFVNSPLRLPRPDSISTLAANLRAVSKPPRKDAVLSPLRPTALTVYCRSGTRSQHLFYTSYLSKSPHDARHPERAGAPNALWIAWQTISRKIIADLRRKLEALTAERDDALA